MRISHICCESRLGQKMTIFTLYAYRMNYVKGNIPKLFIDCGGVNFWLFAGATYPTPNYDPTKDTVFVELVYDDGTTEAPYERGHVNLEDLYERLSHPEFMSYHKNVRDNTANIEKNNGEV